MINDMETKDFTLLFEQLLNHGLKVELKNKKL